MIQTAPCDGLALPQNSGHSCLPQRKSGSRPSSLEQRVAAVEDENLNAYQKYRPSRYRAPLANLADRSGIRFFER